MDSILTMLYGTNMSFHTLKKILPLGYELKSETKLNWNLSFLLSVYL